MLESFNDIFRAQQFLYAPLSGSYPKSQQLCRMDSCRGRRGTNLAEGEREAARVAETEPPSPKSVNHSVSQSVKSVCYRRPASPCDYT